MIIRLFFFVFCLEIELDRHWVTSKKHGAAGILVLKQDKFVYIPILKTLELIMQNDSIRNEVIILC